MRALITADIHARKSAWLNTAIYGDSEFALDEIHRVALEENVDCVFGLGDLLDGTSNRSYEIQLFGKFLDKLQEAGIPFYYIRGNHDLSDPPWLGFHPNAIHIGTGEGLSIGCVNVMASDFLPATQLQSFLESVPELPEYELLLMHQAWEEYMGEVAKPQGAIRAIANVGYVFSGDLHETHVKKHYGRDGQPIWFGSPGSTSMQSISEPGEKYVLVYDNTKENRVDKLPIRSRMKTTIQAILNEAEFSEFLENFDDTLWSLRDTAENSGLPESILKPLVQVVFHPDIEGVERRVRRQFGDKAHFFWKVLAVADSTAEERIAVITKGEAATAESLLALELDPTAQKDDYDLALSLLQAGETETESTLEAYVAQAMGLNHTQPQETTDVLAAIAHILP